MMKAFMRAKIRRDTWMASTMVIRPSCVSTMSAAARAASVAPATAMPMSAFLSAGASFTPSPVMPHMYPFRRSASTRMNLCSGNTWAKPLLSMICCAISSMLAGSSPSGPRPGRPSQPRMLSPMPSCRAVSRAMAAWSPVIIFTSTPYSRARSIVRLVSGRGGSRKVRMPSMNHWPFALVRATARDRMPRSASSSTLKSTASSMRFLSWHRSSTMCGAPFVTLNVFPSGPFSSASVRFRVGSKGV
mmetsp:Transcript_22470/g.35956  ORF Transcript_22470/g.35956 Transcript_22470/m.35956 type:complete len:245 (-) Transcript_22470:382-1116(-)